jgi:hypothetical protein
MPKIRTRNKRRHNRQNKTKRKQKNKQLIGGANGEPKLCINIKDLEVYNYLRVSTTYPNCFTCKKGNKGIKYPIPVRDIVFIKGCCQRKNNNNPIKEGTPKNGFTPSFIEHLKSIHHHCYTASQ